MCKVRDIRLLREIHNRGNGTTLCCHYFHLIGKFISMDIVVSLDTLNINSARVIDS